MLTPAFVRIWMDDRGGTTWRAVDERLGTVPVTSSRPSSGRMVHLQVQRARGDGTPTSAELHAILDSIQFEPAP